MVAYDQTIQNTNAVNTLRACGTVCNMEEQRHIGFIEPMTLNPSKETVKDDDNIGSEQVYAVQQSGWLNVTDDEVLEFVPRDDGELKLWWETLVSAMNTTSITSVDTGIIASRATRQVIRRRRLEEKMSLPISQ